MCPERPTGGDERLKVLTWHVHGSYLYYLSQTPHEFYLPVKTGRPEGYGGRTASFPWPDNVHEIPAEEVHESNFDLVLYQSHRNWQIDQHEILSERQKLGPRVYLEHDPPRQHPTDTRHPVDDADVVIVHVTPFNDLMWDSGDCETRVIEHGVIVPPEPLYTGELPRGIAVVNGIVARGRRLGSDVLERVRKRVPIDLVGMGSEAAGGLGEMPLDELHPFEAGYRFFFNPIRYTSLGLAVCEAMALGMPIVGLATTEMTTAVVNGHTGWVDTDIDTITEKMLRLISDPSEALRLGRNAREYAAERFGIERFKRDWDRTLREVCGVSVAA